MVGGGGGGGIGGAWRRWRGAFTKYTFSWCYSYVPYISVNCIASVTPPQHHNNAVTSCCVRVSEANGAAAPYSYTHGTHACMHFCRCRNADGPNTECVPGLCAATPAITGYFRTYDFVLYSKCLSLMHGETVSNLQVLQQCQWDIRHLEKKKLMYQGEGERTYNNTPATVNLILMASHSPLQTTFEPTWTEFGGTKIGSWSHESSHSGRGVRHPAPTSHPLSPQAAGWVWEQAYCPAPDWGSGPGIYC